MHYAVTGSSLQVAFKYLECRLSVLNLINNKYVKNEPRNCSYVMSLSLGNSSFKSLAIVFIVFKMILDDVPTSRSTVSCWHEPWTTAQAQMPGKRSKLDQLRYQMRLKTWPLETQTRTIILPVYSETPLCTMKCFESTLDASTLAVTTASKLQTNGSFTHSFRLEMKWILNLVRETTSSQNWVLFYYGFNLLSSSIRFYC